ncbi:Na+-transporting NADH:ubiquinone oxidoreductase subunit C [termite gut metagenome]|uniref:Na+-transporting NADH:ubiquinone oxidoreductase subunit C n=1 Tax=termite gut metagenome TaxID=433724 RepID=A0A5J4R5M5_9ZZZZ
MNTNSNSYTIVYASVIVVIVAFVLAFVSSALRDKQEKNVELDKMKQILSALNVNTKGKDAQALYAKYVKQDLIINSEGAEIERKGGFHLVLKEELDKELSKRKLALYLCHLNGETKYVLPLYGQGLWGPIWGYVALNEDKSTIFGVYFSHQGETPGLGAEIASKAFQNPFMGKQITRKETLTSVAVVKPGRSVNNRDYVDGISGGTITSQAVDKMMSNCLSQYEKFITGNKNKEE